MRLRLSINRSYRIVRTKRDPHPRASQKDFVEELPQDTESDQFMITRERIMRLPPRLLNCAGAQDYRFGNSARNFAGTLIILMVPYTIHAPFDAETDYMKELIGRIDAEYGFLPRFAHGALWRAVEPRLAEARSVVERMQQPRAVQTAM